MIEINLVPTELKKKKKSSSFLGRSNIPLEVIVGIGGGFLILLIGFHVLLLLIFGAQETQHVLIKSQWDQLQPTKEKVDSLLNEMRNIQGKNKSIEDLVGNGRILWSRKLNILGDVLPRGVWLTKVTFSGGDLTIEGSSISRQNDPMVNIHDLASALKADPHFLEHLGGLEVGSIQRRNINKVEVADFLITTKNIKAKIK